MEPSDVVGSVVVPVVAILVSAGIAIGLARSERRAAEKARTRAEVVALIRELTEIERAVQAQEAEAARAASVRFAGALNALAVQVRVDELAVPRYVAIVMNRAIESGDAATIGRAALFLANVLDEWMRGRVSTARIAESAPPDVNGVWDAVADPARWREALDGTSPSA